MFASLLKAPHLDSVFAWLCYAYRILEEEQEAPNYNNSNIILQILLFKWNAIDSMLKPYFPMHTHSHKHTLYTSGCRTQCALHWYQTTKIVDGARHCRRDTNQNWVNSKLWKRLLSLSLARYSSSRLERRRKASVECIKLTQELR